MDFSTIESPSFTDGALGLYVKRELVPKLSSQISTKISTQINAAWSESHLGTGVGMCLGARLAPHP